MSQIPCNAKQLSLTTNCACNLDMWRYPAAGSSALVVVPGRTVSPLRGSCPADSPVMRSAAEQAARPAPSDAFS